jgi:hypothetical protein
MLGSFLTLLLVLFTLVSSNVHGQATAVFGFNEDLTLLYRIEVKSSHRGGPKGGIPYLTITSSKDPVTLYL